MIRRKRQTKIVATLGPGSSSEDVIRKLFETGVDVFRLNFSHGEPEDHKARIDIIRKIESEFERPIGVVADLQGPKLRVGRFKDGSIVLKHGMKLRFDLDPKEGDETRVNLPHPEVISAMREGSEILLDDGKVRVVVIKQGKDFLDVEVQAGSKLSNNKGFNVPGVVLPLPALTEKDKKDLSTAIEIGADWIAQSFVQTPADVAEAKRLIAGRAALMIKLEKPSALDHLDAMIDLCDGVMLARGDLGVEIPPENVPAAQKRVVRAVRHAGKPIIVATQMLESMVDNPRPTRAEASDVATAVYDGADAVMLSAETAVGSYPLEAVSIMNRVCQSVEQDELYRRIMKADHPELEDASDSITRAAYDVAHNIKAACIANYTASGSTTLRTAKQRPSIPILCLTGDVKVARRLMLSYGVSAIIAEHVKNLTQTVEEIPKLAKNYGFAKAGERIVLTAGVPFGTPGSTNVLRICWVH